MIRLLFCLLPFGLMAGELLDFDMSKQDKKETGVYKLTEKEKAKLQHWIDNHYEKRAQPLLDPLLQMHGTIQENLQNGKFIRLSDNSLWQIHPKDMAITQGWITPVEILVTQSGDSKYPYKLTNSITGSSVRALSVEGNALEAPSNENTGK